ncbi:family 16 glycoside hydrolase [Streptomyces sp. NPDC015131]|uniref:family 16 glycoside hydrolase n=1 Tax=Streptomyces sp. NPDC015131 TaxID=3364941 RepID=UPI0036FFE0CA
MSTAPRRWLMAGVLLVAAVLLPVGCGTDPEAPATWQEGSEHGPWRVVYDGHGSVTEKAGVITLSPRAATSPDRTHAALVTSTAAYGDFTYRLRMRTEKQLRQPGAPNPWEAAWAVWHYTDDEHFYYVILKPNGWELGKVDPACPEKQCYLATHPGSYPIHDWHRIEVRQRGATMTVRVDDEPIVTHTDRREPYLRGSVGLYTEDATVEFSDISVRGQG